MSKSMIDELEDIHVSGSPEQSALWRYLSHAVCRRHGVSHFRCAPVDSIWLNHRIAARWAAL